MRQGRHLPRTILAAALLSMSSLWMSLCAAGSIDNRYGNVDEARLAHASQEPGQWFTVGRDGGDTYYSALSLINAGNVAGLGLAWEYKTNTSRGMAATPLVVDGVMYTSGNRGIVYALDATTGKQIWVFDPLNSAAIGRAACCDVVNRGVAAWKGRIYVASTNAHLFALDAQTGAKIWEVDTLRGEHGEYSSTGAPQIAGAVVVIGNAGGDMNGGGTRGFITGYDLDTGKQAWRFYTVPSATDTGSSPEMQHAAATWDPGISPAFGRGGNVWAFMAYDSQLGLLYAGTGNPAPYKPSDRSPSGGHYDDLYTDCIIALHADSGKMAWYFQTTPGDAWDYDAAAPLVLADLRIGGRERKVLMQANKNGYFYVLDRTSGTPISAKPFVQNLNWSTGLDSHFRPIVSSNADYVSGPKMILPSNYGAHEWTPMAFSPLTGLVYIPVIDLPTVYVDLARNPAASLHAIDGADPELGTAPVDLSWNAAEQRAFFGELPDFPNRDRKTARSWSRSRIEAWDPIAQRAVWQRETATDYAVLNGGTLATAGNLVFAGQEDGRLVAYSADNGKVLKVIETGTALMAAPMTYEVAGTQYVAMLAGRGGAAISAGPAPSNSAASIYDNTNRIIALKLGGSPVPKPPLRASPRRLKPPAAEGDAATAQVGERLFLANCARCHAFGATLTADLSRLNDGIGNLEVFKAIVLQGAFAFKGMGSFADRLSPGDAAALHAFIVDRATQAYEGQEHQHHAGTSQE